MAPREEEMSQGPRQSLRPPFHARDAQAGSLPESHGRDGDQGGDAMEGDHGRRDGRSVERGGEGGGQGVLGGGL